MRNQTGENVRRPGGSGSMGTDAAFRKIFRKFIFIFTNENIYVMIIIIPYILERKVWNMTVEEIKKLDRHVQEIQYPFGKSYPAFHKLFVEAGQQGHISTGEAIQQYSAWKSGQK